VIPIILAAICGHRLYALFHLLALRGLRRGEALGLQWSDLDLSAATLVIDRQLQQRTSGGGVITLEPKTRAGHRWIALDRGTLTALRTHRAHQAREREAAGPAWCDTGFIFTDLHGHPLMPDHITHLFQKLLTAHDLPPIRLHDLRHGAATLAMNAGVPMRIVQHQIGHESIATTADIYTAVLPAAAQEAAETTARIVQRAAGANRRKFATSGRNRPTTSPRSLHRRVKVRRPRSRR
jgi:integrase